MRLGSGLDANQRDKRSTREDNSRFERRVKEIPKANLVTFELLTLMPHGACTDVLSVIDRFERQLRERLEFTQKSRGSIPVDDDKESLKKIIVDLLS